MNGATATDARGGAPALPSRGRSEFVPEDIRIEHNWCVDGHTDSGPQECIVLHGPTCITCVMNELLADRVARAVLRDVLRDRGWGEVNNDDP